MFLAGAKASLGDRLTAAQGEEVFGDTLRIAVALLAEWVVVPLGGALVTFQTDKVGLAVAGA